MRQLLAIFLCTVSLRAADVTVCASGCTTTSLQTALDTVVCGNSVIIKSTEPQTGNYHLKDRGCAGGTPITVTTDRATWLPLGGTRTTPSHLPNKAIVRTNNTAPALDAVLTAGVPAKHWKFVGIAFSSTNVFISNPVTEGYTYNLILPKNYVAASNSELPDDFTFERCYFYTPLPNGGGTGVNLQNAIQVGVSNLTIKDSFFGDAALPGVEVHNILFNTSPGPATLQNNFLVTSGSTFFGAGTGSFPDYPVWPTNITVQYNYTWRPWKWNNDPAQPYYADFLTNGSFWPCMKNHGEFKLADTVLWQYNGHENMWNQSDCGSQHPGYAMTARPAFDNSPVSGGSMGTISFTDTTHLVWTGVYAIATPASIGYVSSLGYSVCPNITGGRICRPFTTFDNATKTITVSSAFPSAPAGNFEYSVGYSGNATLANVTVRNNVYKNNSQFLNNVGISTGPGVGNAAKLTNIIAQNNLIWNPSTYMTGAVFWAGTPGEESYASDANGYNLSHNTFFSSVNMSKFFSTAKLSYGTATRQNKFDAMSIKNNIVGPSADNPWFADDTAYLFDQGMLTYYSNSFVQNNGFPAFGYNPPPGPPAPGACTGTNTCSGNIVTAWVDPFANSTQGIFVVKPGHAYAATGTDGLNLGVDFSQLPLIKNLKVNGQLAEIRNAAPTINTSKVALLEFDLSGPIQDAGATQPCVVEVSTSQFLHNDLNTYPVINALRPDYFFRPDSTASTNAKLNNPVVANAHVNFPIGKNATVTGDDGIAHDLALLPNTIHYGRAMCYGDTVQFWFKTAAASSSATSFNVSQIVPAAADHYRISYGATAAFGTNLDVVNATPAATTVTVPIGADGFAYWAPLFRASGVTTYTGPTRIQVN